ncbi:MAG: methylated-DNA--[protein]-cysteine S-methyltransferase [Gammaproteobacteria bacterium]
MRKTRAGEGTLGFSVFETRLGYCGIAWGERGLTGVQLPEGSESLTREWMARHFPGVRETEPPEAVRAIIGRITALLNGERGAKGGGERDDLSDAPLDMSDVPPFHRRVYELVRHIAPGLTLTYGEVARQLGQPGAARAVGQALGHNPFAPVVPCHRVLAAGSRPGGFSAHGGADTKLRMLKAEGARVEGTPDLFEE